MTIRLDAGSPGSSILGWTVAVSVVVVVVALASMSMYGKESICSCFAKCLHRFYFFLCEWQQQWKGGRSFLTDCSAPRVK